MSVAMFYLRPSLVCRLTVSIVFSLFSLSILLVETAAGNALFHVIVDTDATAATLMKELEVKQ